MPHQNFTTFAYTDSVKAAQNRYGSRKNGERMEDSGDRFLLTERETDLIATRDSLYIATSGESGWPYVQHRGGPPGFLQVLDLRTLGFADFVATVSISAPATSMPPGRLASSSWTTFANSDSRSGPKHASLTSPLTQNSSNNLIQMATVGSPNGPSFLRSWPTTGIVPSTLPLDTPKTKSQLAWRKENNKPSATPLNTRTAESFPFTSFKVCWQPGWQDRGGGVLETSAHIGNPFVPPEGVFGIEDEEPLLQGKPRAWPTFSALEIS